jgi:LuxR family transcriptional regulator, maltose regulon positive regulatory protein
VTGPLADAVTGMDGCGEMLAGLARENSFVIPLDAAQTRFRYHQLFAEILRYLLQRSMRQAVSSLHERAAAWYEGCGDLGNAVYWAVRVGDRRRVARLLAQGGFAHAFVHRQDLSGLGLRDLLPLRLPDGADAAAAAEFAVASAAIETVFADAGTAASGLKRIPAVKSEEALADADLLASSDLVELVLAQKAGDLRAVDAAANRLLGRSGDPPAPVVAGLRAAVLLAQASTHLWHGRHEDVGSLLDEALAEAERARLPGLELEALSMMAFVESYWSRMNRAEDAAQRAHALRKQKGLAVPAVLELAAALRSLIAGDLGSRARALQRILLPDTVGSDPGLAAALVLGQASIVLACGQADQARIMLHEAGHLIPPVLAVQRDVMLADIETSLGRPHTALRLLRGYRASDFPPHRDTAGARPPRAERSARRAGLRPQRAGHRQPADGALHPGGGAALRRADRAAERGSRAHPGDAHLGHRDRPGKRSSCPSSRCRRTRSSDGSWTCWLAVHGHVDYLCKTTQSLCAPWEMLGIVQPAVALNRAFTWEPAVRALCIKRKL